MVIRQWKHKFFKMAEQSDGCSGETLLAPRKERLQRKMIKDYTGYVFKEIMAYSGSRIVSIIT